MIKSSADLDVNRSYTYADYLTWQFDEYVELIKGKIFTMSPAPSRKHQRVSSQLLKILFAHFKEQSCDVYHAPFDVRLTDHKKSVKSNKEITTVVQPDICVICDKSKLDDAGCLGAPDWIIEILSTGTQKKDRKDKKALYEENGVREYWIVSPSNEEIAVYQLNEYSEYSLVGLFSDEDSVPSGIFPGLEVNVAEIFKD